MRERERERDCNYISLSCNYICFLFNCRLLGSLCEGVEGAAEGVVRGVLVRLLLHTLRPYLSIIHTWLLHGALMDDANEFIVHR